MLCLPRLSQKPRPRGPPCALQTHALRPSLRASHKQLIAVRWRQGEGEREGGCLCDVFNEASLQVADAGTIVAIPQSGGLHLRYERHAA